MQVRVFEWGGHYFELETYLSPHHNLNLLKTSVDTSNEKVFFFFFVLLFLISMLLFFSKVGLPSFVQVQKEVSDDLSYSTHSLAQKKN